MGLFGESATDNNRPFMNEIISFSIDSCNLN